MKHCGRYIIFCFLLISSFSQHYQFSIAKQYIITSNERTKDEIATASSLTDVTVSEEGTPKRKGRWQRWQNSGDRKSKKANANSRENRKGSKKRTKTCHSFIQSQHGRFLERLLLPLEHYIYQKQDPKLAYQMAFLAHVAYWEFHKYSPLTESCQGFRLAHDVPAWKMNESFRYFMFRAGSQISDTLVQGNVAISDFHPDDNNKHVNTTKETTHRCKEDYIAQNYGKRYNLHFSFYNWHESGVAGVKFHDTDVLLSTSDDDRELVIAFAGTASAADAVTNIQTFEPANHSSFFMGRKDKPIQGSLHRGFLNAYSRVDRGSVLRLSNATINGPLLSDIQAAFGHCKSVPKRKSRKKEREKTLDSQEASIVLMNDSIKVDEDLDGNSKASRPKTKENRGMRGGGCSVKRIKLVDLLRNAVISALQSGRTVHVTGHSLGGGLATLLVGDIIINHPEVPVGKLHLWTFGAPQVADSLFLESAIQIAPRLKRFLKKRGNGRFHRFVTLSDDCKVDVVAEVAKNALAAHKRNFHGRSARRLGGVHGHVLHFAEPHYLLTPDQFGVVSDGIETITATHSTLAAHSLSNYLQGLSRESRDHPLDTTMPMKLSACFDET
jgi:hypothetical protein